MPRIRKKTSKRTNLHQRARIKHKAQETRKKRSKDAKKNVTWKSKTPKDPGIPSAFPFKDQILAEIAEERRQVAAEKEKRKEDRKAAKAKALEVNSADQPTGKPKPAAEHVVEEDEEDVPTLLNPEYPNLQSILDKSDAVIHILDARDPLAFRSSHLEKLAENKKIMFVLNKIDTCPREAVAAWATHLRNDHLTFIFRSASSFLPSELQPGQKGKEKERADDALGVSPILTCLGEWARSKKTKDPLLVAVTGIANAGKSSFINSLLRKPTCPVYKPSSTPSHSPSTTTLPQEVTLEFSSTTIHFVDTPALSWHPAADAEVDEARARDILLRNRGRIDRLKDPLPPLTHIVHRTTAQDLMLQYTLPAFTAHDATAFLSGLARTNRLVKKGGDLDLQAAARLVLRDWNTGRFPRYTTPPAAAAAVTNSDSESEPLYAKDDVVLSQLSARAELRRGAGLVKLVSGGVEGREVVLDGAWWVGVPESDSDSEEAEEEGLGDLDLDEVDSELSQDDGSEEEEDDDEGEEEEEPTPPPAPGKRKRPAVPIKPSKKVAFSNEPHPSAARTRATKAKTDIAPPVTLKSALKSKAKPVANGKAKIAPTKAKANSKAQVKGVHQAKDGELAYDFGKFF